MSTPLLLKDTASSITVFLERASDGSAATGLDSSTLQAALRKTGAFVAKALVDPAQATADIGAGANGTVTTTIDTAGVGGNDWTIEVTAPAGTTPLNVTVVGTVITVELSVNGGVPVDVDNTATLIAAAITAEAGVTAAASGTGGTAIDAAEGPTDFTGGVDGNLVELGDGFYSLDLTAADTNTAGSLYVRFVGPTIRTSLVSAYVAIMEPVNPVSTPTPTSTELFGFLYGPDGSPLAGAAVSARVLSTPLLLHPENEGVLISSGLITAKTDSDGFFSISLLAGSTVDLFISSANYRRTLVVPASSSNLFDLV